MPNSEQNTSKPHPSNTAQCNKIDKFVFLSGYESIKFLDNY